MSIWNYYMPLWGGILLGALFAVSGYHRDLGASYIVWSTVNVLMFGVGCQLTMLGVQGASAQVLPVPFGKSIRGRGAVVTGVLLLLAVGSGLAASMMMIQKFNAGMTVAWIVALALLLSAAVSYFWCMPTAVADFGTRE